MSQAKGSLLNKLKFYHILLLSCLFSSLLILNSNYANQKREQEKLSSQSAKLFNNLISRRKLSEASDRRSKTNEVCSRGSDDLVKYYQTGDLSLIDLDNEPIKCDGKDESYMKALRALAKKFLENDKKTTNNLRNLDEGDSDKDNIVQYAMRILAMIIFLIIGVLSIFGWIACCIFTCCDCCCCCCCKKADCKIPCFIFTYTFYALSVSVCIYGLTQSNKIFEGLANTECSLLQFFDQILYGEDRDQSGPHWAGIEGINTMLTNLDSELTSLSTNTNNELQNKVSVITSEKSQFKTAIEEAGTKVFDNSNNYLTDISHSYNNFQIKIDGNTMQLNGNYIIDLVARLGKYDNVNEKFSDGSILSQWNGEYSFISGEADRYIRTAQNSFTDILGEQLGPIKSAIGKAQDALSDIKEPFDDVNSQIGDGLSDYSEKIDKYGKLAVKLVFSVMMVMNIGLATFMTLIGLCSMKSCADCCFCRCLFKSAVHILWNILALMMILSFLVGSILGIVGKVGDDMMSLVSFIFSSDNFNEQNPLFLNRLGDDGKRYINRCINGDGNIGEELEIDSSIDSINNISAIERSINSTYNSFYNLSQSFTYNGVKTLLSQREELTSDFIIFEQTNATLPINFDKLISNLNSQIEADSNAPQEKWGRDVDNNLQCGNGNNDDGTFVPNANFNPSKCDPIYRDWIIGKGAGNDIYNLAQVIHDIMEMVKNSKDETKSFMGTLKDLNTKYGTYLHSYLDVLEFLQGKIGTLIDTIRPYIEEGNAFSFLNGKFIGTNIKILLKYLKYSLGQDIYTVGLCLIIVGFSLIFSISSTILLIVIINIIIRENMNSNPNSNPHYVISEFKMSSPSVANTPLY